MGQPFACEDLSSVTSEMNFTISAYSFRDTVQKVSKYSLTQLAAAFLKRLPVQDWNSRVLQANTDVN